MLCQKAILAGILSACFVVVVAGCGTTRTSNSQRTATEQLLISDAIDRSVESLDFSRLAGETVYFDHSRLMEVLDDDYLISSFRQHILASGCILKDVREEATYVVEPRVGAVGTDNDELLFGLPATNVPQVTLLAALPPAIPEVPIAKRHNQRGVAKIAVFAYHRETGQAVWQSGTAIRESTSTDIWVFGAGPFKRGSIYKRSSIAGKLFPRGKIANGDGQAAEDAQSLVKINSEATFHRPRATGPLTPPDPGGGVRQASALEPMTTPQEVPGLPFAPPGPPRVLPPPVGDKGVGSGQ